MSAACPLKDGGRTFANFEPRLKHIASLSQLVYIQPFLVYLVFPLLFNCLPISISVPYTCIYINKYFYHLLPTTPPLPADLFHACPISFDQIADKMSNQIHFQNVLILEKNGNPLNDIRLLMLKQPRFPMIKIIITANY